MNSFSLLALAWLSGCWFEDSATGRFEEYWTAPAGGTMLGIGRMVGEGKTLFHEYMTFSERNGAVGYEVLINGQRRVKFKLERLDEKGFLLRAEDGETLTYERLAVDSLLARLERPQPQKALEFRLTRRSCEH